MYIPTTSLLQGTLSWIDYTPPNETGWSAAPWLTSHYILSGNVCILQISASGTSDSTAVTFDAPIATTDVNPVWAAVVRDNTGSFVPGRVFFNTSIQILVGSTLSSNTWTASGNKQVFFTIHYTI